MCRVKTEWDRELSPEVHHEGEWKDLTVARNGYHLLSLSKIGSEERKSRVLYAENMFEPMEEDVMVNTAKGSAEDLTQSERRHLTIITSNKKTVQDSTWSGFSGVTSMISRLKLRPKSICVEMINFK